MSVLSNCLPTSAEINKFLIRHYFLTSIVFGLISAVPHARSAVFEYNADNGFTVASKRDSSSTKLDGSPPQPSKLTANQTIYQKLTRSIAVKYSGFPGVRTAGLDALAFIDVFETLIRRESNFNPKAVSPKGAIGLGQLMPNTAAELGVKDPLDPAENLHGSAKYFTQQLEQFGSLDLALAAYNAGPKRVRKYHGIPPFAETRSYIKWIRSKAGLKTRNATTTRSSVSKYHPHNLQSSSKGNVSIWEF